jgi:tRNA nucleotidyltransferase (CCA-adding enzyme)
VAPETAVLMRQMVEQGEVDALVPERVWQEVARGLMEAQPSRMFMVLRDCGALARILPELDALWGVPQPEKHHPEIDTGVHVMMVIDYAARQGYSLPIRFAALTHDLGKGATPPEHWPRHHGHEGIGVRLVEQACQRLKVPGDCRDLARIAAREHGNVSRAFELRADTMVKLFERCDAFRKPQRFLDMLRVSECDQRGRTGFEDKPFPHYAYLESALNAARGVDAGAVAKQCAERPQEIPDAVRRARVKAVEPVVGAARRAD